MARSFYGDTLGVETEVIEEEVGCSPCKLAGGRDTLVSVVQGSRRDDPHGDGDVVVGCRPMAHREETK